jgi:hypothetical protein
LSQRMASYMEMSFELFQILTFIAIFHHLSGLV